MTSHDAIHELARRARTERSLHLAEILSDVIYDVVQFTKRQFAGPDAGRQAPVRQFPAPQR
jgi:hypothetical protein